MITGIYWIRHRASGKTYIGQSWDIERRWKEHEQLRSRGSVRIHRAIKKYGWENFEKRILFNAETQDELNALEIFAISFYETISPNGYNLTHGGGNGKPSDETRERMSAWQRGRVYPEEWKQRIRDAKAITSDETRKKLSDAAKRRAPMSEETRRKMSESQSQRLRPPRKPFTEEHRRKMSESAKKRPVTEQQLLNLRKPRADKRKDL